MMKTVLIFLLALLSSCGYTFAQTVDRTGDKNYTGQATIGTDTTAYLATPSSAWLQVGRDSTTKGMLPPRVVDTSDVTSPSLGNTVFQIEDSTYYVYKDHWRKVGSNIADYIKATEKGVANGVATLDSNGLLEKSQVPAIAITNTFVVASMTDMLNLAADTGDICIRTDSSETFILQSTPATTYDNWKKLLSPGAPVTSVNGYTGVVTLGVDDIAGAVSTDRLDDSTAAVRAGLDLQAVTDNGSTTTKSLSIGSILNIIGGGTGASTGAIINFYESDGTTRSGVVGDGNSTDNDMYITSYIGGIRLDVNGTDYMTILHNGNIGFHNSNPSTNFDFSGNAKISGITGVGTSSLLPWSDATLKSLQIGDFGGISAATSTATGMFWTDNMYRNSGNWYIASNVSDYPSEVTLTHGGMSFYSGAKGSAGDLATLTNVFSVDRIGNLTASAKGSFQTLLTTGDATIGGSVTATGYSTPTGTSSEVLTADGGTAPLPTAGTPLVESVNHPLSNPSGTAANTDVQLQLDGSNYSYTIAAGTFASGDNMLIRIKFMYDFDITSGTTAEFKLDIGGTKYAVTPTVTGAKHGMGEVDITDVGTDTLHIVEVNDGAYLGDDLITALDASDAITITPYYSQSVTSLGDECNIRPFTVEVMKVPTDNP